MLRKHSVAHQPTLFSNQLQTKVFGVNESGIEEEKAEKVAIHDLQVYNTQERSHLLSKDDLLSNKIFYIGVSYIASVVPL